MTETNPPKNEVTLGENDRTIVAAIPSFLELIAETVERLELPDPPPAPFDPVALRSLVAQIQTKVMAGDDAVHQKFAATVADFIDSLSKVS